MKTKNLATILVALIVAISVTSCNNDKMGAPGTIQLNAASQNAGVKSATIETTSGTINLLVASVEIQNLQIEENSGNDNEGNHQDGNQKDGKESSSGENDGGDIALAGPYVFDIANGIATIDAVDAQPGNYKKVNFDFVAGTENGRNSIALSGNYVSNSGTEIPFILTSPFEANIQLPLVNGITVNSGSTVSVSIVFDVAGWLSGLDFENAVQTGINTIVINPSQNIDMYTAFIAAVSKNIEVVN